MCQTFLIRYKLHVVFWKMKKESECGFPSIMCACLCMCVCVLVCVCVCVCGSLSPSLIHHGYPAHLCRPTVRVPLSTTSLTRAFDTRVRYVQPKCKHTHHTHTHNPLLSTKMCNSTHTQHTHITHTTHTHTQHTSHTQHTHTHITHTSHTSHTHTHTHTSHTHTHTHHLYNTLGIS